MNSSDGPVILLCIGDEAEWRTTDPSFFFFFISGILCRVNERDDLYSGQEALVKISGKEKENYDDEVDKLAKLVIPVKTGIQG
jgi:hypothetical protein